MELKKGNSVKVKAGVLEPDTEQFEIGGWQGRIVEIDSTSSEEGTLVGIEWDVETLKLLPADYITQSEMEGLGWEMMVLFEADIEKAESRDSESDVKRMQDELAEKYYWSSLGEDGVRIAAVLGNTDRNDGKKCFDVWYKYLDANLTFPIKATVSELEVSGKIKDEETVVIHSLSTINDKFGINATVKLNNVNQDFPLCDLDAADNQSANYQLLYDYAIWFSNK
ncbi:MAG: calcium-binding protein [Paludibacter sp.]|nr:calcium-binding protein [Paludibacter sp.]